MAGSPIDLDTWPRKGAFDLFKTYDKPHYAICSRIDATELMTKAKPKGVSVYRACLYAIGAGIQAVPEMRMRFSGEEVYFHDQVALSMTVPLDKGGFGFGYAVYEENFRSFDKKAATHIAEVAGGKESAPNTGQRDDLIYLSCLPWLDFTSLNNAMPGPDDCIPRVSWGKIMNHGDKWDMAVAVEVHHALVDGEHLGKFFTEMQQAINSIG